MRNLLIITQKVDSNDQLLGFFIGWLRIFAQKFGKVTVLCLEKGDFILPDNVVVISLGKDRGKSKLNQLLNFYKNIFVIRNDYNSVFVHMNPIWAVLGGLCWRVMGKKVVLWYTHKAVTLRLRVAEKLANVILTASKESFRLSSSKVIVTGHGIDTDVFKPDPNKKISDGVTRILSVGRIAPVKNYGVLIEAAQILNSRNFNFCVDLVGEAALKENKIYENQLKSKIKNLGLEKHFKFIGKVNHRELVPHYQSHDIFVHFSRTGSLDKTLLEAMACGMKVLSSNDAACAFLPPNLIIDDKNPLKLADKIIEMKSMPLDAGLRDYVINNHNLESLLNKITGVL